MILSDSAGSTIGWLGAVLSAVMPSMHKVYEITTGAASEVTVRFYEIDIPGTGIDGMEISWALGLIFLIMGIWERKLNIEDKTKDKDE